MGVYMKYDQIVTGLKVLQYKLKRDDMKGISIDTSLKYWISKVIESEANQEISFKQKVKLTRCIMFIYINFHISSQSL